MFSFFFFNDTATTEIYTLSLHDALPISAAAQPRVCVSRRRDAREARRGAREAVAVDRSWAAGADARGLVAREAAGPVATARALVRRHPGGLPHRLVRPGLRLGRALPASGVRRGPGARRGGDRRVQQRGPAPLRGGRGAAEPRHRDALPLGANRIVHERPSVAAPALRERRADRKSTRLNSSHGYI